MTNYKNNLLTAITVIGSMLVGWTAFDYVHRVERLPLAVLAGFSATVASFFIITSILSSLIDG